MARAGPDGWREVTMRVPVADDHQRRAIAGLLGRPVRAGTAMVAVRLADLDATLIRAGDGWDLPGVVEAVDGPLPDRAGDMRRRRAAIDAAIAEARQVLGAGGPGGGDGRPGDADWVERWLADLGEGLTARLHGRAELHLVATAARVLARLPADDLPLPALAAGVTGDTKALAGTPLASLVLRGLAIRGGEPQPRSAGERRALWESVGVVPDDLASQVLVLGLPVASHGPLGGWLAEAAARGWPFRVTLHQLARSPLAVADPQVVSVCENPAVLRAAAERFGAGSAPLVCTEGRPSVACLRLLTALRTGGCQLRYHGDFDWPGIRIATSIVSDLGAIPWRMGADDYIDAVASVDGARPRLRGAAAATPWDPRLGAAMAQHGVVIHEEDVLEQLLGELAAR
jgi:uncharacterized protein (TIGR02679 family)